MASSSSAGKRRAITPPPSPPQTVFPRWPHSNDESEYWEVPPDHFLAQQDKATSRLYPGFPSSYHSPYLESQAAQPGPSGIATATTASHEPIQASPSPQPQPLAELAHFLALDGGQNTAAQLPTGMPDTSTLAGADFDIDVRSGFLPPQPPVDCLPADLPEFQWEQMLRQARAVGLKVNGGGTAVDEAEKARCRRWRRTMRELAPVTPSHKLRTNIRYARRGHVVLTFLAHFYIHSQPQPLLLNHHSGQSTSRTSHAKSWLSSLWNTKRDDLPDEQLMQDVQDAQDAQDELEGKYAARLPASISVPLLLLSSQLDLPPILTYADTVLWNWRYKEPSKGLVASNLEIVETFTGTLSEHHFFLTSLRIELRGVAALDIMRVCLDECFLADGVAKRRVAQYLNAMVEVIADLEQILHDVRKACEPSTFYWAIRPWFRGGDSSPHPVKGWIYPADAREDGLPSQSLKPRIFTGPSAGQSSLIHALDVFFDVDHARVKARPSRPPCRAVEVNGQVRLDGSDLPEDATFMQRMQLYMPGQHRRFLTHLQSLEANGVANTPSLLVNEGHLQEQLQEGSIPDIDTPSCRVVESTPLRHLATTTLSSSPSHPLPKSYNAALQALRSLRDEHMRVATLYIISQARSRPPPEYAALNPEFVGGTLEGKASSSALPSTSTSTPSSSSFLSKLKRKAGEDVNTTKEKEDLKMEEESRGGGGGAKGTGGTNLVQFLKACRINTVETLLGQPVQQVKEQEQEGGDDDGVQMENQNAGSSIKRLRKR